MTDWAAVSALVSGRTKQQCRDRWHNALNSRIDRANGRKGMWTVDEDNRLEHAIQMHSGKNWGALQRWFRIERNNSVKTDGIIL
jgi:hypothetical protein